MSIFNHFKHLNLSQGQETALTKLEAFLASPVQVFMLKGYAGSGKTTILKGLVGYLSTTKKEFILMAPTGRAAKVLRDKTGQGVTIHKGIYDFSRLESINKESEDEAHQSFHYHFPLNDLGTTEKIIIIDESSMISSVESKNELFTFGTNILLDDLLTFSKLHTTRNKIIFVGDPAQLPPYGDNKSLALESKFFRNLGLTVEETEMKDVQRHGDNLILKNAKSIRELLADQYRTHLQLQFDNESFIKTEATDIVEKYTQSFPVPEVGNGIVISFSNAQCYHYNIAIREKIFPGQREIVSGDLLLINSNNYYTYGAELFNGDFAKVVSVSTEIVTQVTPVYCDLNGVKVKRNVTLNFRQIIIRVPTHPDEISCYIIDSLLQSVNRDLSTNEMKALYINFVIRFNEQQKKAKESGQSVYKIGSEEFRQSLKKDPFFNALKVKFGYAITCHKAQGGEWDKVFVDYHGRVSLKSDPLRWCYTATTRAINCVYAINAPQFRRLDKFKFATLGSISTLPNDSLALHSVVLSPYHKETDHKCKSLKYWELLEKFEDTDYSIINIESLGGYHERYTVMKGEMKIILDGFHKGSGHFTEPFKVISQVNHDIKEEIEYIFNAPCNGLFQLNYNPDFDFLADLHSKMQADCEELNITITNVVKGSNNYVTYFLTTDSLCSYIQFYYNAKGQLTTAMPKTYNCSNDKKLQELIQKLLEYAS